MSFFIDREHPCQLGVLVENMEEATQKAAAFFGKPVPPIVTTAGYEQTQAEYRGAPCYGRIYQSFFDLPNIQLELIQPMDEMPSVWRECLDEAGNGLHHLAFQVKGMAEVLADCQAKGMPLLQRGEYPGGRYAYVDDRAGSGMILEFLEND
ncbi:MAG: VOC family protein [Eubacteriales bacterium]|nr:VOC family protein [Eubacteriales bacterium]